MRQLERIRYVFDNTKVPRVTYQLIARNTRLKYDVVDIVLSCDIIYLRHFYLIWFSKESSHLIMSSNVAQLISDMIILHNYFVILGKTLIRLEFLTARFTCT